jgi:hypothetical protein
MSRDPLNPEVVAWVWSGELADHGYTNDDLATLARVLSRHCPHCKAEPGQWCRTTGTRVTIEHLDSQHVARRLHRDC